MVDRRNTEGLAVTVTSGASGARLPSAQHCHLMCFEGDTCRTVSLPEDGELLIGRAPDAGLRLRDERISRRHAQLMVIDQEVRLTDLDSRHGVWVNGERCRTPRQLMTGDVITLGDVTLVFHRTASPNALRALVRGREFRRRLEEEIERTLEFRRVSTLAILDIGNSDPGKASIGAHPPDKPAVVDALAGRLRLIDTAGFLSVTQLALILPGRTNQRAQSALAGILKAVSDVAPNARVGVASCPMDGCDVDTLISSARAAAQQGQAGQCTRAAETISERVIGERRVIIADPAMLQVYRMLEKLAHTDMPILVTGETGAGKELAAATVHYHSARKDQPFVAVNCAALPESLAESELFGHEKGAFTGATSARPGVFERASGGTLFLDELGELSATVQAKLLRVLENQRVTRVGGTRELAIDTRLVAATNRDMQREIEEGRFRKDLFYRLGAARVLLPPLRERRRELPVLASRFVALACERMGRDLVELAPASMQRLFAYHWPGNVRELQNAMNYAVAMIAAGESEVEVWHLPHEVAEPPADTGGDTAGDGERTATDAVADTADDDDQAGATASRRQMILSASRPANRSAGADADSQTTERPVVFRPIAEEVQELEKRRMTQALEATDGARKRAAALISMPLRTFVTKLKRYEIDVPRGTGS